MHTILMYTSAHRHAASNRRVTITAKVEGLARREISSIARGILDAHL